MKLFKYLSFITILTFGVVACSDDEPLEVEVTNDVNTVGKEESTYRVDKIEITSAGSEWTNGTITILIADNDNDNLLTHSLFVSGTTTFPIDQLVFGSFNESTWRVHIFESDINRDPSFMVEVNPANFRSADGTFTIPIENQSNLAFQKINISLIGRVSS